MDATHRLRHRLEYVTARAFFAVAARLPLSLGWWVGRVAGLLARSRARKALENLRTAFPAEPESRLRSWARGMWANLGLAALEFARTPALTPADYARRVEVEGLDLLKTSHARGKGVVFFAAHLVNWEWTSLFVAHAGLPMAAVARRMKNPLFDEYLTRMRSRHGVTIFSHRNAVREGLRWLKQGRCLGILVDQRITAGGVQAPFFGCPAHTTTMPALLAQRTGAALHGVSARRVGEKIRIKVHPAFDLAPFNGDLAAATAAINAALESWIRLQPEGWLWLHDRWKP